jgi:hypothetical protein
MIELDPPESKTRSKYEKKEGSPNTEPMIDEQNLEKAVSCRET